MTDQLPTTNDKLELLQLLEEAERRKKYFKIASAFPITGEFNRFKYQHALDFFKAGHDWRQRLFCAANRIGKTYTCGYEVALHLTGLYNLFEQGDEKWEGKRFDTPIKAWVIGESAKATKSILQDLLIGNFNDQGSGLIPKDHIVKVVNKAGNPECIETVYIKHFTNGIYDGDSQLDFMAYEQGPTKFQGTSIHVVWMDEEADNLMIKVECATRTMKTSSFPGGILLFSWTPWKGATEMVMSFLPDAQVPINHVVPETNTWAIAVTWDDVPHLTKEEKEQMLAMYPAYQRASRSRGEIAIGVGLVYPISENDYVVEPFDIPAHWRRAYGMDVGYLCTAVVWAAEDPNTNTWYIYKEHYTGREEPVIHAAAIKAAGEWIPGVVDPAANKRRDDGTQLLQQYRDLGLDLTAANNAHDAGITKVWTMLTNGSLKVFSSCTNLIKERRIYKIDEKGKIPEHQRDHAMDAERYLISSGLAIALAPVDPDEEWADSFNASKASKGANPVTGY